MNERALQYLPRNRNDEIQLPRSLGDGEGLFIYPYHEWSKQKRTRHNREYNYKKELYRTAYSAIDKAKKLQTIIILETGEMFQHKIGSNKDDVIYDSSGTKVPRANYLSAYYADRKSVV